MGHKHRSRHIKLTSHPGAGGARPIPIPIPIPIPADARVEIDAKMAAGYSRPTAPCPRPASWRSRRAAASWSERGPRG